MSVSSLYGSRCGLVLSSEERGSAVTSACWQCTIVHYKECWQCTIVHYREFKTIGCELTPFKQSDVNLLLLNCRSRHQVTFK